METETAETRKRCRITRMAEAEMQDDGDSRRRKMEGIVRLTSTVEVDM